MNFYVMKRFSPQHFIIFLFVIFTPKVECISTSMKSQHLKRDWPNRDSPDEIENEKPYSQTDSSFYNTNEQKVPNSEIYDDGTEKTQHLKNDMKKFAEKMHIKPPPTRFVEFARPELFEASTRKTEFLDYNRKRINDRNRGKYRNNDSSSIFNRPQLWNDKVEIKFPISSSDNNHAQQQSGRINKDQVQNNIQENNLRNSNRHSKIEKINKPYMSHSWSESVPQGSDNNEMDRRYTSYVEYADANFKKNKIRKLLFHTYSEDKHEVKPTKRYRSKLTIFKDEKLPKNQSVTNVTTLGDGDNNMKNHFFDSHIGGVLLEFITILAVCLFKVLLFVLLCVWVTGHICTVLFLLFKFVILCRNYCNRPCNVNNIDSQVI